VTTRFQLALFSNALFAISLANAPAQSAESAPDTMAARVLACASCHGAHGEGMATFPRLAGQHAPYLLKQLLVIQSVLRTAPVMHGVIKDLTKDQMQAVVAYLESI